jgi:4-aminobutyrate aminotransferase-like enzyme/Ser/Thr protein kinase RdoA (MazF antagonist)
MVEGYRFKDFSKESIRELVREIYGLEVSVSELAGERDINFKLEAKGKKIYVFKLAHPGDSREMIETQHQVMERLAKKDRSISCPQPVKSLAGKTIHTTTCRKDRQPYDCHLLTFLEGDFYAEIKDHPPELEEDLGRFLGKMDRALRGYSHPALNRNLIWDLKNIRDIRPFLNDIPETGRKNLVRHFIQAYETEVEPLGHLLPRAVIHNDANDYNILVNKSGTRVAGIIDFGDMVFSHRVQEAAAALAYAVMGKDDPVDTIIRVVSGYHSVLRLREAEIQVLFHLIAARLCISVALSAYRLKHSPGNEYLQISASPAWEVLEKMSRINPNRITRALRRSCGYPQHSIWDGLRPGEILKKRLKQIGHTLSISYQNPLKMTGAYMQYLFDHEGRTFLDTVNNVCHVGHCHPRVVEAAQSQMGRLNTNTRYLYDSFVELAESLCSTFPSPLRVCYFVNSGSEANELAIRLARTFTGRRDFIVIDSAYHGNTNAVIEISPYKSEGPGGTGLPGYVHKVRMPDTFRGEYRDAGDAGEKYARDIEPVLEEIKGKGGGIAGFIAESIISVGGQIFLPKNYLNSAYRLIRNAGGICIADEVQVGFGRVGSHFWAFEQQGVVPDIVTMGKPMGNGHPVAAVVTTPEIDKAFTNGMEYFNTFGGNPVSCTIAKTVLEVIRSENLQQHAAGVGKYFLGQLKQLMGRYDIIGDVRGSGLFLGIELVRNRSTLAPAAAEARAISNQMREQGILTSVDGKLHNVIKIKPPLPFDLANVDFYIEKLDQILRNGKN